MSEEVKEGDKSKHCVGEMGTLGEREREIGREGKRGEWGQRRMERRRKIFAKMWGCERI